MSTTKQNLFPQLKSCVENHLNICIVSKHGTGKTTIVRDVCEDLGIKYKYYSCATLDPYTDLVGIPVPRSDEQGHEKLIMVRPRDIDEAEVILFDEFNRADEKVTNACMEIIQFQSINGEKLPNLRSVIAMINPINDEENVYHVNEMDDAVLDRFDVFHEIQPAPSVPYLAEAIDSEFIAKALCAWWTEHDRSKYGKENYISPRRLEKIGQVFLATGDYRLALPLDFTGDKNKLGQLLQKAKEDERRRREGKSEAKPEDWGGRNLEITYERQWIKDHRTKVAHILDSDKADHETHKSVLNTIQGMQGMTLGRDLAEVLNAIQPSMVEGWLSTLNPAKLDALTNAVKDLPPIRYGGVVNLRKCLSLD